MYDFVGSPLGWIHLSAAFVALFTGAVVLIAPKGTRLHKRVGYLYCASMVVVCGTALGIYRLTGSFMLFHVLAIVGFVTLVAGMAPILLRHRFPDLAAFHLWFMYYSVLGLYAAFASELLVRVPDQPFFAMVGVASGVVFAAGSAFIFWKQKVWSKFFY